MSGDLQRHGATRSGHSLRAGKAGVAVLGAAVLLLGTQLGDDEPLGPTEPEPVLTALAPPGASPEAHVELASPEAPVELGTLRESDLVRTSGENKAPDILGTDDLRIEGDPIPPSDRSTPPAALPNDDDTPEPRTTREHTTDDAESAPTDSESKARSADAGPPESEQPAESLESEETTESLPPPPLCGVLSCATGYVCCNFSCGTCVPPGASCDQTPCEQRVQYPVSVTCGRSTCNSGQVCCNESCGTCANPGEACDTTPCDNPIQYPISIPCGRSTCSNGQVCCNPSCGICVEPGQNCSSEPCN